MRHFKGKLPVWFRGDSTLLDEPKAFSVKKIFRRIFLSWVYKHADKAFYVGTNNKNYFKAHGLRQNQLIYAPHAVDNGRFLDLSGEKEKKAQKWRSDIGFSKEDYVLLYAGKLELKKNPFFLIDLSNKLLGDKYKFLIVGNGKLEKKLKIASKNDKRFIFLNFQNQSQMPIVYRLADFFILPSIGPGESWGLALNEALACGTKVLASNKCGGTIDLISETNGLVFNPIKGVNEVIEFIKKEKYRFSNNNSLLKGHDYNDIVKAVIMEINQLKLKKIDK
jgi:glycosyltransferase involved in cell wall biosynthesis